MGVLPAGTGDPGGSAEVPAGGGREESGPCSRHPTPLPNPPLYPLPAGGRQTKVRGGYIHVVTCS